MTRSADEIRSYLHRQVNSAVRRLGMYGDEVSLILLFDALAYAEDIEGRWQQERDSLRERRAFNATGVRGALENYFPAVSRGEGVIASVYAEFAHREGWLDLDRTLTTAEYRDLKARLASWCLTDRAMSDVEQIFGPPSVLLGGTNPNYPKTFLYGAGANEPVVCFHLWNRVADGAPAHTEPILLAARTGDQPFPEAFHFTPTGKRLRPVTE